MSLLTYQVQALLATANRWESYDHDLIEIRLRLLFWIDELLDSVQDIDDELNDEY